MATLAEAFGAVIATIIKALLKGLVGDVLGPLVSGLGDVVRAPADGSAEAAMTAVLDPLKFYLASPGPATPEQALVEARRFYDDISVMTGVQNVVNTVLETASLGQIEAGFSTFSNLMSISGAYRVTSQIFLEGLDAAWLIPLRRYHLSRHRPIIPDADVIVDLFSKGWISGDTMAQGLAETGVHVRYADALTSSAFTRPDVNTLTSMLWRGEIPERGFRTGLTRLGIPDIDHDKYLALTKQIPGPGDLITMVVREVISPDVFYEMMPKQGFFTPWPERYWEMHWILLPLGEVRRARHRGLISDDELDKFLVLHDYKPEPRPGITTSDSTLARRLIWDLPGRIDARWMFRWGQTDREGLKDLLIKGGLDPEYADAVTDATAMNQFLREIRMQETNIKADLRDGYVAEDTARADLLELGYPGAFVDYHIADALKDRDRQHKKRMLDMWDDAYQKDLIGDGDLTARAAELLADKAAQDLYLEEAYVRKYKKPKVA